MSESAALIAREFLSLVWDGQAPDELKLLAGLDRLLARSHEVEPADCAVEDRDPPKVDGPALYKEAGDRFPALGYYPVSDPTGSMNDDRMLCDAIDDLADITRDFQEVVWRDENLGPSDAAWFFRLMYMHWGRHARELAIYLHARQFG